MFISIVVDLIHLSKDNICQSKRHFVVVKLQHDAMDPVTIAMLIFPTHGAPWDPWSRRNVSTIIHVNASRTLHYYLTVHDRSHFKDPRSKFNLKREESRSDD